MTSGDEHGGPLWLPPRRPEPEPERPLGPQGFLPPRAPGGSAPPAGRWAASTPPPSAPRSTPPPATSGWGADSSPWTPEGVVLATWGSRAAAALIDTLVVVAVMLVVLLPLLVGVVLDDDPGVAVALVALAGLLAALAVAVLYAPVMLARTDGQTLGKMALGIRVIRTSGESIDFGYAFLREVLVKTLAVGAAGSATFGAAQLVDLLWPLWDDQNRALHDMVAQSRVIRAR